MLAVVLVILAFCLPLTSATSWLNMVERFFRTLTDRQIRRGVFTSVKELEARLAEYIDTYSENPRPFVWTKSAKQILEKPGHYTSVLPDKCLYIMSCLCHPLLAGGCDGTSDLGT